MEFITHSISLNDVSSTFTAHNILLDDGTETNNSFSLISGTARWKAIKKTIELFFPLTAERAKYKAVDLGCLEGGYTVELARMGFDSLGIEIRQDSIDKCEYVKAHLNLPNLRFAKDDVLNIKNHGKFDVTFCCGLFYHLADPDAYLKTLCENTNNLLILDTHFALEKDFRFDLSPLSKKFVIPLLRKYRMYDEKQYWPLSKLTTHENRKGCWFKEYSEGEKTEKVDKMLWASHGNTSSFWPCKKDLIQSMHDAGFTSVFEQFDYVDDLSKNTYSNHYDRCLLIGVKKPL